MKFNNGIPVIMTNDENDGVDFIELLTIIWRGKWFVIATAFTFMLLSVVYAVSIPNIYRSEVLLAPVDEQSASGLNSTLGGLASLAGVGMGTGSSVDKVTLALEILQSRHFISQFIERHNILVEVMAVKGWDYENNTLIFDNKIFDPVTEQWIRDVNVPMQKQPSLQEASKKFNTMFKVDINVESKMITLALEYNSPFIAKNWLDLLVLDINTEMKRRDIQEAERGIAYLKRQVELTNVSEVRGSLFSLIEEQTKTLMLANVRDEYIFNVVDPAIVPEQRFKPKRAIIVLISLLFGVIVGMFSVLIFANIKNRKLKKTI